MLLIRISSSLRLTLTLILALVLLASGAAPAAAQTSQESDQDAESGEIGQSGKVLNSGDNSNQCVALQPVANTGNAETEVDIIIETPDGQQFTKRAKAKKRATEKPSDHQYNERDHDNDNDKDNNKRQRSGIIDITDLADELDLDLEDIGSTIELSPEQRVECNQAVNQAATASDTSDAGYCTWYWDAGWWCYWSTDGSWWYQDYYGSYTAYDAGWWYWDGYYYWWSDGYSWWWTDGYYWYLDYYSTAGNVAAGILDAARGTLPLVTLGALTLIGTAGIVIRRNRRRDSDI